MPNELKELTENEIQLMVELLGSLKIEAEEVFRARKYTTQLDSETDAIRDVFVARCLDNCIRHSIFISKKVNENKDEAQFYLSQVRTLIEIVVKVAYILSIDSSNAARVLICEDMLTAHKIHKDYFSEYVENLQMNAPFLVKELNYLPYDYEKFSKNKLKSLQKIHEMNFLYPDFYYLIDEAFVRKNTPLVQKYMSGNLKQTFDYSWKSFSEHVHGNHFFNEPHGNEIYWINLHMLILLGTVIEIVDRQILGNELSARVRLRFSETKKIGEALEKEWKKKPVE